MSHVIIHDDSSSPPRMEPVVCECCGARFSLLSVSPSQYRVLQDRHYYDHFAEELRMLLKVKDFYRRHPEAVGKIKSDLESLLESNDSSVVEKMCDGVHFDEIEIPIASTGLSPESEARETEVIQYLRTNTFSLDGRLEFVDECVKRYQALPKEVRCHRCESGLLRLDPELWEDPHCI